MRQCYLQAQSDVVQYVVTRLISFLALLQKGQQIFFFHLGNDLTDHFFSDDYWRAAYSWLIWKVLMIPWKLHFQQVKIMCFHVFAFEFSLKSIFLHDGVLVIILHFTGHLEDKSTLFSTVQVSILFVICRFLCKICGRFCSFATGYSSLLYALFLFFPKLNV